MCTALGRRQRQWQQQRRGQQRQQQQPNHPGLGQGGERREDLLGPALAGLAVHHLLHRLHPAGLLLLQGLPALLGLVHQPLQAGLVRACPPCHSKFLLVS